MARDRLPRHACDCSHPEDRSRAAGERRVSVLPKAPKTTVMAVLDRLDCQFLELDRLCLFRDLHFSPAKSDVNSRLPLADGTSGEARSRRAPCSAPRRLSRTGFPSVSAKRLNPIPSAQIRVLSGRMHKAASRVEHHVEEFLNVPVVAEQP